MARLSVEARSFFHVFQAAIAQDKNEILYFTDDDKEARVGAIKKGKAAMADPRIPPSRKQCQRFLGPYTNLEKCRPALRF